MNIKTMLISVGVFLLSAGHVALGQSAAPADEERNIQAYVGLLRADVRKAKAQVISEVMQLDATQAAKFWPVYQEFEAEYSRIGDGIQALVKDYVRSYEELTPEIAGRLTERLFSLELQRAELRKKYTARFSQVLDKVTALRFLLVENQLEKLLDLQLASQLPAIP